MHHATFATSCLTTFCHLDELGLEAIGQLIEPDRAVIECRVVRLAGDALDRCRQRVQQDTIGHRGRASDPLYKARRTLHTGASLLTEKQSARLNASSPPTASPTRTTRSR